MKVVAGSLKQLARNNTSLVLVVLGSLSNFLLILFLKKFAPDTFNSFSLYITYISIVVSFGLIGFDQIFLRLSEIEKERVLISKDIFISILITSIVAPAAISYYFNSHYDSLPFIYLFVSGVGINFLILAYNALRLRRRFLKSQAFNNGYKIFFLLVSAFMSLIFSITINQLLLAATLIICLFSVFALFSLTKSLKISDTKTPSLFNFFFSFSVNIGLLTLLSYGERILIVNELGEDVFGKYFYYSTVFLFPLTLIQYYVGFKELVVFKEKVEKSYLYNKLLKIFVIGILLVGTILSVVWIDGGRFLQIDFKQNILFICLLTVLGITKLMYGLFSALLGAQAKYRDLYIINILTAVGMGLLVLVLFNAGITINRVILGLICIFTLRGTYIYYRYV